MQTSLESQFSELQSADSSDVYIALNNIQAIAICKAGIQFLPVLPIL